MKHSHHTPSRAARKIPLAAFLAAAGCVAHAQSHVTLFGAVDLGLRSVHNEAGSLTRMYSGNNYTSRLGFRGEEDLAAA